MLTHEQKMRHKLTEQQIETILDRLVPLIASDEDQGFFRGVLHIQLSACNSSQAAAFVAKLLKTAGGSAVVQ